MPLSVNKAKLDNLAGEAWKSAELLPEFWRLEKEAKALLKGLAQ
jgi:hypothetical protein